MRIITTRRITQVFFFLLFVWFCVVATLGQGGWQLRGWPVNWFLQLDPLVGLGVLLATHTLYAGLLWAVATIVLTLFLGRFFCGWVCPMGALQQFVGYLGLRRQSTGEKIKRNQPHRARHLKYGLLLFFVAAAALDLPRWFQATLQTGLLDPIPLLHRSVNLVLLPLVDGPMHVTSAAPRFYSGTATVAVIFVVLVLLCLRVPRFYCRFLCPLGALLGWLGRWSLWRIGVSEETCRECRRCEAHCEGACTPAGTIQTSECVLCLNCRHECRHGRIGYRSRPSAGGERLSPDLTRRHVVSALAAGVVAGPVLRVGGGLAGHWDPRLIRPPGALDEADFLHRCVKCGQCMRICPTNVIHPATWETGLEGLWTPVLNFRIGTSGCQPNCVACSHICPTAALRPLTVEERMGVGPFAAAGPLRSGMAFVDRGRCLPWALDTPCIVCQENCPVSPKAIFTRTEFRPLRRGLAGVASVDGNRILLDRGQWPADALASGDFYLLGLDSQPVVIRGNTARGLTLDRGRDREVAPPSGHAVQIAVRLQQPYVDPQQCIGCGICEHECPVQGRRAIRVSAENESRHPAHGMLLGR